MSTHRNGLAPSQLIMDPGALANALARVNEPNLVGAGMVLSARGNVYGDVRTVDPAVVAKRRARNKAARKARRIGRNR
jgi:hypothetical protein